MCEASHWSKIHSYICIFCYVLCVFCDVHIHSVDCATEAESKLSGSFNSSCEVASSNASTSLSHGHTDELMKILKSSGKSMDGRTALERLLRSIGLGEVHEHELEDDHDHEHSEAFSSKIGAVRSTSYPAKNPKKDQCISASEYYDLLEVREECSLNEDQFKEICPSLVYQMVDKSCIKKEEIDVVKMKKSLSSSTSKAAVWGCSIAAVIVISLVGLLAVALIPLMKKSFYDILVQFLIAVGVGTLVGDAILHLIPHALVPHDHSHDGAANNKLMQDTVWKTSMALIGIYVFFLTERLTTMIQSYRVRRRIRRRRTRLSEKPPLKTNGIDEGAVAIIQSDSRFATGDSECINLAKAAAGGRNSASSVPTEVGSLGDSGFDLGKLVIGSHGHSHSQRTDCNVVAEEANRLMHQTPVHHCHSHDFSSIKAIAWTVIMGDGLHNFCDGVAIGAAFTDDLRGGLSTSLAVIWHELPHEIGDFAVLLKAGMSVKMAVFYNILSSIFCFVGMVIGITIGGMHNVTPWVFMLATGMFIYIALVDMLPNLTCDQVDENGQPTVDGTKSHRKLVFLVQNMGILTGFTVMSLIALYEDKILS